MEIGDGKKISHYMVLKKMEKLLSMMQHPTSGIHVESQKNSLRAVPGSFTGTDFLQWLMEHLKMENSSEALHLGNFFCQLGYIYPVSEGKTISLKDDGTLYRFQTPYFWPSLNWQPDHVEYAIYLTKRSLRNRKKYELDESEQAALTKLQKMLCDKWDFIYMQAQEQVKLLKDRKKSDRLVIANQEKAFWRIQRPVPGQVNGFEVEKHSFKLTHTLVASKKNLENLTKQVNFLETCLKLPRTKFSKVFESLINRCQLYQEHDPFLVLPLPSNPWVTDDVAMWELDGDSVETPTERRVKKWSFCFDELLRDPAGLHEFELFLESEFSSENISFWLSVEGLKGMPQSKVEKRAQEIYQEFLAKGAPREINIDSKTMGITVENLKKPTRLAFEAAQSHIFLLMKKDSYARFLRSDQYKTLLALAFNPSKRKKFFNFGNKKRPPNTSPHMKRRGSANRGKMGNTGGVFMDNNQNSQHSYSTGNLKDLESDEEESAKFESSNTNSQFQGITGYSASPHTQKVTPEQTGKKSNATTKPITLDMSGTGAVSQNEITPWEDESVNVVTPWEDASTNVVTPWEDNSNAITPWEDKTPNEITPWDD